MTDTEIIDDILDNFNFEKVVKVMNYLDWVWYQTNGEPVTVADARKMARWLLTDAMAKVVVNTDDRCFMGCGGFRAEVETYADDPKKYARLAFELEDRDSY